MVDLLSLLQLPLSSSIPVYMSNPDEQMDGGKKKKGGMPACCPAITPSISPLPLSPHALFSPVNILACSTSNLTPPHTVSPLSLYPYICFVSLDVDVGQSTDHLSVTCDFYQQLIA